jgi:hypothetical protein
VPSLPPRPILLGAGRWADLLVRLDRTRAWNQLRTGAFQDLTPTQYAAAFDWLVENELVDASGRPADAGATSLAERVLAVALDAAQPAWFADDQALADVDDLPADLVTAAGALSLSMVEAQWVATARAGKVNAERRALVGALGERLLVELLQRTTTEVVMHVSLDSDHWGFDVRLLGETGEHLLEVKTTGAGPRVDFYVSRHEVDVARREQNWSLVLVTLKSDNEIASLAVVDRTWLVAAGPYDRPPASRWESARMRPAPSAISPGLESLDLQLAGEISVNDERLLLPAR